MKHLMKESFHYAAQNKGRLYGAGWKEYLKYDHTSTHTHTSDKILFLIIHMWMSFTLMFE